MDSVYSTIFRGLRGVNIGGTHASNNYLDLQPEHMVFHDNMYDYSTNEPTMDGTASLTFHLVIMRVNKHAINPCEWGCYSW